MASNNNQQNGWLSGLGMGFGGSLTCVPEQQQPGASSESNQYEQLDRTSVGSNTLKRNPKMELSKNDLLKLVTYFEGEIQARDIAIAAMKSERLKQVVNVGRYRPAVASDPYTALLRDSIADGPNVKPVVSEQEMAVAAEQQLQALEQLALQQRRAHQHMINILKDAEAKHRKVIQELEEEKCKHEHDTAQGDDITYGLEMERTRLRQELEMERSARKKLEKEVKKQLEMADEERARQKQIVLLLLAERKKIIVKYIEERKRSEDLAQVNMLNMKVIANKFWEL
jgi:transposase-like protein